MYVLWADKHMTDDNIILFPVSVMDTKDVLFDYFTSDFVVVIGEIDGKTCYSSNLPSYLHVRDVLVKSLATIQDIIDEME